MKLEDYIDLGQEYENEVAVQIQHENRPLKGTLGCKDDCCDYPDCAPSCRARWYHK